jgi:hypothetical protein
MNESTHLLVRVALRVDKKLLTVQHQRKRLALVHYTVLENARFCINEKARARSLRTGKRTLHAWVEGHLVQLIPDKTFPPCLQDRGRMVHYSRSNGYFSDGQGRKVESSPRVLVCTTHVVIDL